MLWWIKYWQISHACILNIQNVIIGEPKILSKNNHHQNLLIANILSYIIVQYNYINKPLEIRTHNSES